MSDTKLHWRKRKAHMMEMAQRAFRARNRSDLILAWLCLFEWARLGGTREEGTR